MNRPWMNRRLVVGFTLIATFAAMLAVLPGIGADPDPLADAKALTRLDEDWSKAAATRDAEKVAAFYAEDAIAYPPNAPVASGRAAAKKVWASYFAEPSFAISWKTVHAGAAKSGDLGFTAGTYEVTFKGPDGKPGSQKGKYLCTWAKQKDGSWKAAHDMWNSDSK